MNHFHGAVSAIGEVKYQKAGKIARQGKTFHIFIGSL
jgi:hypothetical protein